MQTTKPNQENQEFSAETFIHQQPFEDYLEIYNESQENERPKILKNYMSVLFNQLEKPHKILDLSTIPGKIMRNNLEEQIEDINEKFQYVKALAYNYEAKLNVLKKQKEKAVDNYTKAIKNYADEPFFYNNRATILTDFQNEIALADINKCLDLASKSHEFLWKFLYRKSLILESMGKYQEAAKIITELVEDTNQTQVDKESLKKKLKELDAKMYQKTKDDQLYRDMRTDNDIEKMIANTKQKVDKKVATNQIEDKQQIDEDEADETKKKGLFEEYKFNGFNGKRQIMAQRLKDTVFMKWEDKTIDLKSPGIAENQEIDAMKKLYRYFNLPLENNFKEALSAKAKYFVIEPTESLYTEEVMKFVHIDKNLPQNPTDKDLCDRYLWHQKAHFVSKIQFDPNNPKTVVFIRVNYDMQNNKQFLFNLPASLMFGMRPIFGTVVLEREPWHEGMEGNKDLVLSKELVIIIIKSMEAFAKVQFKTPYLKQFFLEISEGQ